MKKIVFSLLCEALFFGFWACEQQNEPTNPPKDNNIKNDHAYVDLGLSVKWATCNIGASKPEEFGDYFAWGETQPKNSYGRHRTNIMNPQTITPKSKFQQFFIPLCFKY